MVDRANEHLFSASAAIGNTGPEERILKKKEASVLQSCECANAFTLKRALTITRTDSFSPHVSRLSTASLLNWIESNLVGILLSNSLSLASTKLEMTL